MGILKTSSWTSAKPASSNHGLSLPPMLMVRPASSKVPGSQPSTRSETSWGVGVVLGPKTLVFGLEVVRGNGTSLVGWHTARGYEGRGHAGQRTRRIVRIVVALDEAPQLLAFEPSARPEPFKGALYDLRPHVGPATRRVACMDVVEVVPFRSMLPLFGAGRLVVSVNIGAGGRGGERTHRQHKS